MDGEKREISRKRSRDWRNANKERARSTAAAYRKANRKKYADLAKKYRAKNPDRLKQIKKQFRARHKERLSLEAKQYRLDNSEKVRAQKRRQQDTYAKKNPEKIRTHNRNARARRRAVPGSHSSDDVKQLFKQQKGKCAHQWCRTSLKIGYHVDHMEPLALGGTNDRKNLQLLCEPCNLKKHAKHPIDFAQQNGLLL